MSVNSGAFQVETRLFAVLPLEEDAEWPLVQFSVSVVLSAERRWNRLHGPVFQK